MYGIRWDERLSVGIGYNDPWGIPLDEQPLTGDPMPHTVEHMRLHGMDDLP